MHRHRYEPVSVQHGARVIAPESNATWVLYRCRKDGCPKNTVEVFDGKWTLDEVKGRKS